MLSGQAHSTVFCTHKNGGMSRHRRLTFCLRNTQALSKPVMLRQCSKVSTNQGVPGDFRIYGLLSLLDPCW
jgi:hypothetical protein